MIAHLFDTNIISELMRWPDGAVAQRIAALNSQQRRTSIIVACDLYFGAAKKQSARVDRQLAAVIGGFQIEPFSEPAEREFGFLRTMLERQRKPIGAFDILIAAHAMALDYILVTDSMRGFARIEGLKIENRLR